MDPEDLKNLEPFDSHQTSFSEFYHEYNDAKGNENSYKLHGIKSKEVAKKTNQVWFPKPKTLSEIQCEIANKAKMLLAEDML